MGNKALRRGKAGLKHRLILTSCISVFAASCASLQSDSGSSSLTWNDVKTYQIEMGKDDEILARIDLQIAGEEDATYDRTWPLIAEEFCIARRVDLPRDVRRMAETQSVRVSLTPLRRNYGETARSQLMDVRASWRTNKGMPEGTGLDTPSCKRFPTVEYSASFAREVPINLQQSVTLFGDEGLYLKVAPK